jgi:hypothetical protein
MPSSPGTLELSHCFDHPYDLAENYQSESPELLIERFIRFARDYSILVLIVLNPNLPAT